MAGIKSTMGATPRLPTEFLTLIPVRILFPLVTAATQVSMPAIQPSPSLSPSRRDFSLPCRRINRPYRSPHPVHQARFRLPLHRQLDSPAPSRLPVSDFQLARRDCSHLHHSRQPELPQRLFRRSPLPRRAPPRPPWNPQPTRTCRAGFG